MSLALYGGLGAALLYWMVGRRGSAMRVWPVVPKRGVISGFGVSREGGRYHAGIDVGAYAGDRVVAIDDGVVLHAVTGYGIYGTHAPAGYVPLQAVAVRHPDADYIYAEIMVDVKPGDTLRAGQTIGRVGRNGDGNAMLHLEAWETGTVPKGFTPWNMSGPKPKGLLDVGPLIADLA